MEINSWHGRIDVEQFITLDTDVLTLSLTRSEILFLQDTSESLISRAIPGEDPASIVFTDGATANTELELLTNSNTAQSTENDLTTTVSTSQVTSTNVNSGSGAMLWLGGLIFITLSRTAVGRRLVSPA